MPGFFFPKRNDNEWTKKDRLERMKMLALAGLFGLAVAAGIGLVIYSLVVG